MTTTATTISLAAVMTAAWASARAAAARFGGKARHFFRAALATAWADARKPAAPVRERIEVGREGYVRADLEYTNYIRGGGAITPTVSVYRDYGDVRRMQYTSEGMSGSRRSGWISWQLEANRLYRMDGVNVSSTRAVTYYVSTFDGVTKIVPASTIETVKRALFPVGYELAQVRAEQARVAEEARQARLVVEERERLERMKIEAARREAELAEKKATLTAEAAKVETEGQQVVEGLPLLTGSPKQVAWALRIRDAVQKREPKNAALKRAKKASYWIENYRTVLGGF
ncbi:hypothetical protein [Aureimonas sp. AU40]|uniref:hypothetical protein n=1 Tax=Aureimonas sp. AU40 TaxID=1637747 RepID=UPI0007837179|nr:hypothetical protein [Aureimonas sp. AU40]